MTLHFSQNSMPTSNLEERPVAFADTMGHLHAVGGSVGVVICGPWGFDEVCSRKFHRILAEGLATKGYSTLRFDYPGEGDALDVEGGASLESWIASAVLAAGELKRLSGCSSVIFYGLGLGGIMALSAAERFEASAGVVLAAPALNGRRFLREVGMRERVIRDNLAVALDSSEGSVSLAGFVLPINVASALRPHIADGRQLSADLPILFLKRPDNPGDEQTAAELCEAGLEVEVAFFPKYSDMMAGVNVSIAPSEPVSSITGWLATRWPIATDHPVSIGSASMTEPAVLEGQGFRETAMKIGTQPSLHGVLCEPQCGNARSTVVFLNMAYAYHIGWGGIWVDAARSLALDGIRSLRVDLSNIGDSPRRSDMPTQVVYSHTQQQDIRTIVDQLRTANSNPIYLVGTCSGAYAALSFAGHNDDIAGSISVNQLRMIWDPDEDVDKTLSAGARPLAVYRSRAFSLETYRRLMNGRIDIARAARNLAGLITAQITPKLALMFGKLTKLGRMRNALFTMLRQMEIGQRRAIFVACRTDGSLDELARYFGPDLAGLNRFANVEFEMIEGTDHMLTPLGARRQLVEIIRRTALVGNEKVSPSKLGRLTRDS
jgi:predicted alpha/beta hydrolase